MDRKNLTKNKRKRKHNFWLNIAAWAVTTFWIAAIIILIVWMLTQPAAAAGPETDYMAQMIDACMAGDSGAGHEANRWRNTKIIAQGLDYSFVDWDELYLLSRLIYCEAGADVLGHDWRCDVGEVVMHRVESPEFPSTLSEVIYQAGQYGPAISGKLETVLPTYDSVLAALECLEGRDTMPASVIYQDNAAHGPIYRTRCLAGFGTTYFCHSANRFLYGEVNQ